MHKSIFFFAFFLGGRAPVDRQSKHSQLKTINMTVFVFMCSMASLGICLAFMFLCFNVRNRHRRYAQQQLINFTEKKKDFSSHILTHYPITQNNKSYYFMSCHVTSVTSRHVTSYHVIPRTSCYVMLCHNVMLRYAMPCHFISCHLLFQNCHSQFRSMLNSIYGSEPFSILQLNGVTSVL